MIKVENVDVWGFEHAIRGMRNPMNSWDKSDSHWEETPTNLYNMIGYRYYVIGENDLDLMRRLYKAGTEHRKYLRQIFVSMDIIAPLYWWKEMDQYRINVTTNSCSTMHTIHKKEFELDDFSHEHLSESGIKCLEYVIAELNSARKMYLVDGEKPKKYWWDMIQLLPSSYNQKRTVTMNYENIFSIIKQRKYHKLDEWIHFCDELKKLPYVMDLLVMANEV